MTTAVLVGSLSLTAAFVCGLRWVVPATPPLRALLAGPDDTVSFDEASRGRLDEVERRLGGAASRLLADLGLDVSSRRQADLAVMDRPPEEYLGTKVVLAILGSMAFLGPSLVLRSSGASPIPDTVPLAFAAAVVGFFLPAFELRRQARRRRDELAAVVGFLCRVARVIVAGGKGLDSAIDAASSFGDTWAHLRLRRALSEVPGRSPREALAELGQQLDSPEAETLADTAAMAQRQGTPLLGALTSIARTIRLDRLHEAEAKQSRKTVWMSVPVGLMVLGYMGMFIVALVAQVISVFNV